MVELETDGIDVDALETLLETAVRPKLAHIIPNFQNPAGYTLSAAKRERLLALAAEYGFTIFEDDPYVEIRFQGEPLPTMLSQDDAGTRRLRVVVLQDGLPRHPRRLPGRPAGGDQADPGDRDEHVHLAGHGRAVDRPPVLRAPAASTRRSRRSRTRWATRRDAVVTALERELPEATFTAPEGGYFMWVELPEEVDVAELEPAAAERGVAFVKGTDFLLEGGEQHAAPGLLGRDAGPDRRGHHAAGRGAALARGRRLARASSATTTGRAARSSASCSSRRRRPRPSPCAPRRVLARGYGRKLMRPLCRDLARARLDRVERRVPAARAPQRRRLADHVRGRRARRSTTWPRSAPTRGSTSAAWSRSGTPPAGTWPCGRRAARLRGRAGARARAPAAVSQAGVVDLRLAWELRLSNGVVGDLLGGGPRTTRRATRSPPRPSASRSACPCC